jgi:peroxiredoxin Q/BCP
MLKSGDVAPDFTLSSDDGHTYTLSEQRGKRVVIYFYPKDMTPGCTTEACDFNADIEELGELGAVVWGISRDSVASHARFRSKYELEFPLLSDPDLTVHKAYGAWNDKTLYGKLVTGAIRSTFLIDIDGTVAKAWHNVRATGHAAQVKDAIKKLASTKESAAKTTTKNSKTGSETGLFRSTVIKKS